MEYRVTDIIRNSERDSQLHFQVNALVNFIRQIYQKLRLISISFAHVASDVFALLTYPHTFQEVTYPFFYVSEVQQ